MKNTSNIVSRALTLLVLFTLAACSQPGANIAGDAFPTSSVSSGSSQSSQPINLMDF